MEVQFNANAYLNDEELAAYLGCTNVLALRYERKGCVLPAPDMVFKGRAYWSPDTARSLYAVKRSAISQAFGHPEMAPSEAPDPLRDVDVVRIRWMEDRMDTRPCDDSTDPFRGWR